LLLELLLLALRVPWLLLWLGVDLWADSRVTEIDFGYTLGVLGELATLDDELVPTSRTLERDFARSARCSARAAEADGGRLAVVVPLLLEEDGLV
jgi:hypothetical protein